MIKESQPIEILLVEDNPSDVLLTREAFASSNFAHHISVVNDGTQAIEFLQKQGEFSCAPVPKIILLDLNLPTKDGYEVLSEMKNDPGLVGIPVIVLSTSNQQSDIRKAYALHANCYIVKPVSYKSFCAIVREIETFWFSIVSLP